MPAHTCKSTGNYTRNNKCPLFRNTRLAGRLYLHTSAPGYPPYLPSGSWYVNNTTKGGRVARIRTSFLMEYGDGGFTTIDSAVHVYRIPNPILLLTMRGKYDTIHPHGNVVAQTLQPTSINAAASQHLLPSGTNIMLTSDVIDLMAADTIQTVITFKKRFTGRGKYCFTIMAFSVFLKQSVRVIMKC